MSTDHRDGISHAVFNATFLYDHDGRRVAQTVNGVTTYFVGGHYEVTGSQVTKYYFAGTTRIAMRKYTIPQSMGVEYFLGDHLGSTSITTDANGAKVSEMRYKAWGEVRYSWTSGQSATPAYELAKYTFTGQYSYTADFGLMFYNARWYDPALGRFAQADTIIPQSQGVQAWDRYAYTNNSPVNYTDPSGHCALKPGIKCPTNPKISIPKPKPAAHGDGLIGPPINRNPSSIIAAKDPTITTVMIGGVNPTNVPGHYDDDSPLFITNVKGGVSIGIPTIISVISPIIQNNQSPSDVDVWLTFTTMDDGSIDNLTISIDNHDGGSTVDLNSGVTVTTHTSDYIRQYCQLVTQHKHLCCSRAIRAHSDLQQLYGRTCASIRYAN